MINPLVRPHLELIMAKEAAIIPVNEKGMTTKSQCLSQEEIR